MRHTARIPSAFHREISPPTAAGSIREIVPVSIDRFVQVVPHLGRGNLVVRGGGLSIFHRSRLRLNATDTGGCLSNSQIGLTIHLDFLEAVWLIEPEGEPARFEIVMRDSGESVCFYPSPSPIGEQEVDRIRVESLAYRRLSSPQSLKPSAQARWLDQGLEGISSAWKNRISFRPGSTLCEATASMQSEGLCIRSELEIASLDLIEDVFRLASLDGDTVIHLTSSVLGSVSEEETLSDDFSLLRQHASQIESWSLPFINR